MVSQAVSMYIIGSPLFSPYIRGLGSSFGKSDWSPQCMEPPMFAYSRCIIYNPHAYFRRNFAPMERSNGKLMMCACLLLQYVHGSCVQHSSAFAEHSRSEAGFLKLHSHRPNIETQLDGVATIFKIGSSRKTLARDRAECRI